MKKRFLAGIAAALVAAASSSPILAADGAGVAVVANAATLGPNAYVWRDEGSVQPVSIVISIPDQKAYVYRGETLIAASSVSTGKDGKETPTGTFPILQKEEVHHSNLYDSATMPFMQRLTWDGVAIHAGRNPGFPASHGCIRVPAAFAKKLFAVTSRGTPVMVTEASADEGWTPPVAYDPIQMEAETARANATQLDAIMDH